jgi:hypothetical protein
VDKKFIEANDWKKIQTLTQEAIQLTTGAPS